MTTARQIADSFRVTVHGLQVSEDASALVGETTLEVAADGEHGPATLYVNDRTGALEWDVSGWPPWYRGTTDKQPDSPAEDPHADDQDHGRPEYGGPDYDSRWEEGRDEPEDLLGEWHGRNE